MEPPGAGAASGGSTGYRPARSVTQTSRLPMLRQQAQVSGRTEGERHLMANSPGPRPLTPEPPSSGPRTGPRRRTLDPDTAYQVHDQPGVRETVFVVDALLVRGRHPENLAALAEVTAEAGFELVRDEGSSLGREVLERAPLTDEQRAELEEVWVERVRLAPRRDREEPGLPADRHLAAAAELPGPGGPRLPAARRRRPRAPGSSAGLEPTPSRTRIR